MTAPIGTLLPLTSLSNFQAALDFIAWLKQNNQQAWQMLPLSDEIATPYRNQGIGLSPFFYDPHIPQEFRTWVISRDQFVADQEEWLLDYALYQALAEKYQQKDWRAWPDALAAHDVTALAQARQELHERVDVYIDQQYFLANQMLLLRRRAAESEIMLIGDLPFYLAPTSSLVWSHQELFQLGEGGQLVLQSGVPAAFDEPFVQQFWGHPLYDWAGNSLENIMNLFALRLRYYRAFFDLIRIDHANGFFRYGAMSPEHPAWCTKLDGPGNQAVEKLLQVAGNLELGIYFEDIASDKLRLEQFMKHYQIAGTRVLTLLYNLEATQEIKVRDRDLSLESLAGNNIVFSSTHDTVPLITWVKSLPTPLKERFCDINNLPKSETDEHLATTLRERLLTLDARLIIIPWQDWQLDDFRFNVPGHEELTNWHYLVDIKKYLKK